MRINLVSWNVNGLRAMIKKPHWSWFSDCGAQIIALQETKAMPEQLPEEILSLDGWQNYWSSSIVKKGYSGVSVFSRIDPIEVKSELPDSRFQGEGRLLHLEFSQFHFFNGYFPNGGAEELDEKGKPTGKFKRLGYKMGFLEEFLNLATACKRDKPVVVCGDFNIAHEPIDLSNPKANEKTTGFLPEERDWMDRFIDAGFVDSFRHMHGNVPDKFTWWSYKNRSRPRNVGWRLDYFFVSRELLPNIRDAWISSDVEGSDHCPVGLSLEF